MKVFIKIGLKDTVKMLACCLPNSVFQDANLHPEITEKVGFGRSTSLHNTSSVDGILNHDT